MLSHCMVQYRVVSCGVVWYGMLLCGVEDEWMEPPKPLIMGEGGCNTTVGKALGKVGGALRMVIRHGRHGRGVHLTRSGGPSALCLSRTPMSHFVLCL